MSMTSSVSNGITAMKGNFPKVVVMTYGLKGGIGKTALATTACATLREIFDRVALLDADTVNLQLAGTEADVKVINFRAIEIRGPLDKLAKSFESGEIDAAVIDTPANLEADSVDEIVGWFRGRLAKAGVALCVMMPITLGSFVQRSAAQFVEQHPTLPVVFVEQMAQGRKPAHFRRWRDSKARARCLEAGAVSTFLSDAGVEHGDEAAGYGLSIADVAQGDFAKAGAYAEHAETVLNEDVQLYLAIWLDENIERLAEAIQESVRNQAMPPAKEVA